MCSQSSTKVFCPTNIQRIVIFHIHIDIEFIAHHYFSLIPDFSEVDSKKIFSTEISSALHNFTIVEYFAFLRLSLLFSYLTIERRLTPDVADNFSWFIPRMLRHCLSVSTSSAMFSSPPRLADIYTLPLRLK